MMRALILPLLGLIGGVSIGVWWARVDFINVTEEFSVLAESVNSENVTGPRLTVVGGAHFDFGTMERFGKREHTFVIKNVGTEALKLKEEETTCKCTLSKLDQTEVQPGESVDVTLSWTAKEVGNLNLFEHSATISTNDEEQPFIRLVISGEIIQSIRPYPSALTLGNILAGEGATVRVNLISYKKAVNDEPLKLMDTKFLDPSTSKYFEVQAKPLPAQMLSEYEKAVAGLQVEVKVKPGAPFGRLSQNFLFALNLPDAPGLEVPFSASVAPDIHVMGIGSKVEKGDQLILGDVEQAKGATAKLLVIVRGEEREKVELKLKQAIPELLEVKIGERRETNNGTAIRFPVEIRVPPNSQIVDKSSVKKADQGRIVLTTGHPKFEELYLFVKFRIVGSDK